MRNKVIAGVLVVAVAGGGVWFYQNQKSKAASAQSGQRFVYATVQRGAVRSTISGTGPAASVNGVLVKANQPGTVAQLFAQDGDRAKAGQVIMKLSNDSLAAAQKQAQLDLQNNQSSLENLLNPLPTSLQSQELKVRSAQLTLAQRQKDVANLTVSAPVSGVVTAVKTTEGSSITAGTLLFTVWDDATPTFVVAVPQYQASLVATQQRAVVTLPGLGEVEGQVVSIGSTASPAAGHDATVNVSIALRAVAGLRPGLTGQASLFNGAGGVIVQPSGAVDNDAVEVRAQVAGTAHKPSVVEGQHMGAGDLLMRLENDTLRNQLDQAQNDLTVQQQTLSFLQDPSQDPSSQLRSLRSKVEQAQVTLTQKQDDLNELEVKAPVDGQVSSLVPRVGDKITTNQTLFRVADYNAMQITISVDELDIAKVQVGKPAEITLDALPGHRVTGKVSKINPEGIFKNDIATFEVTIAVDNAKDLLAGMNATVNIVADEKTRVLWLPAQAVRVQQGKAFVQIEKDGKTEQKEVTVGLRTSQQVEIVSGLNDGEQVVLTVIRSATQQGGFNLFGGGGNRQPGQTPGGNAPAGGNQGNAGNRGGGNRNGGAGN